MQSCRLAGLLAPCRTEHTRWLRGLGSAASTQVLPGNRNKRACMHAGRQVSTLNSLSATGWITPSSQHFPLCLPACSATALPCSLPSLAKTVSTCTPTETCMPACTHASMSADTRSTTAFDCPATALPLYCYVAYPFWPNLSAVAEAAIQLPDEPEAPTLQARQQGVQQGQECVELLMRKWRSFMQQAHFEWWQDYGRPGAGAPHE